jgi:cytochrome c oxidase subunit 3
MKNLTINRRDYQVFPYHLVEPSPWPILTSFALLTLTVSAVLYMHGFVNGGELLLLGFILTAGAMTLWFRDILTEGTITSYFYFIFSIYHSSTIKRDRVVECNT